MPGQTRSNVHRQNFNPLFIRAVLFLNIAQARSTAAPWDHTSHLSSNHPIALKSGWHSLLH